MDKYGKSAGVGNPFAGFTVITKQESLMDTTPRAKLREKQYIYMSYNMPPYRILISSEGKKIGVIQWKNQTAPSSTV